MYPNQILVFFITTGYYFIVEVYLEQCRAVDVIVT